MNNKNWKTYNNIYTDPILANLSWTDIESLLIALGATISEGNGSRARIELNGVRAVFHRPHKGCNTDKGAIKSLRKFLENAGIEL